MTEFLTITFLLIAVIGAGLWLRRNQARKLAEQRAREESERLAAERKRADENAAAEAKARENARLQAEAEEQSRNGAEARECARLAEEEHVAAEKLVAEAETKRRADQIALADAQAREAARLKEKAEAKLRAEAEAREKTRVAAEEEQRAEERRQAEAQAKADAEARERARKAAEEEARRLAVATVEKEQPPEGDEAPRPPTYQPTAPSPTTSASRPRRPIGPRAVQTSNADLHLRVQLQFGRGGVVRNMALLPDRRDGMPTEIEVAGTQGKLNLIELREDCYEAVPLSDAGNALLQGMEWNNNAEHWRWVLGGRELYVLAPGDEFGLCGFISTARLRLNARHVVLAAARLRDEVMLALTEAGCNSPEISDELSGAPPGWLLFRNVIPTRPVQRNERDILNALRPAHEIEPHFIGGIRLERNSWLADFPPRIRFTGEFANGFQVMIDGQSACQTGDGGFEAPGWNSEGEHRLWFGDRAGTYSIRTMDEEWQNWPAHNFGTGVAICGASTRQLDSARRQQVRVPTSNPVLVGSNPGEIFRCDLRNDVRCETVLKMIPFTPVWALPLDSAHADKKSARILLFRPAEPAKDIQRPIGNLAASRAWISVIREAGSKGLSIAPDDAQSKALWQRYRIAAKQLRRRMR